jgi:hypothetical protein
MDNSWVFDIQDKIYSRLDAVCRAKLSRKYPNISVTMDNNVSTTTKFPNVYLHFLPMMEIGNDLDGKDINAVYLTAQVDVTVTNSQEMSVANEVSQVVVNCMKDMRFNATLPEFVNTSSEYRTVSRFTRTIGNADELY